MADFPKSRIEAIERAEQCGMSPKDGSSLYLSKGQDTYDQFTAKQEKCFAQGPDVGFLDNLKGKVTGFFNDAVAGAPKNLNELKGEFSPNSTAGLLRDRDTQIARQMNQQLGM